MAEKPGKSRGTSPWPLALGIFALAFLVHLPSLAGGFVYDDHYEILGDGYMRQGDVWMAFRINLWDLYSVDTSAVSGYYRPLTRVLLWWAYQIAGPDQPWFFHLNNVLVHSLNCAMVAVLGEQLFRSRSLALTGGLLFALHPRHMETVCWPTSICDLFCWCSALAYLLMARRAAAGHPWWWLGAAGSLCLSALTKEAGLLVPGLALLCLGWNPPGGRALTRNTVVGFTASAAAAFAVYFYLRLEVAHTPWPVAQGLPFSQRLLQGPYVFARLLQLAVWPFGYGLFRGPVLAGPAFWQWWVSLAVVAAFGWAMFWGWRRRRPELLFFTGWWLYCVAPVLGVLTPIPSLMSDRHIYLAVAALTWGLAVARQRFPHRAWVPILTLTGLIWTGMTWRQIAVWTDEVEIWKQSKATCPENTVPRINLAWVLADRGLDSEALEEYLELLRLGPDLSDGYLGAAGVYLKLKQPAAAQTLIEQALARGLSPRTKLLQALAQAYQAQAQWDKALEQFRASLQLEPNDLGCRFQYANCLGQAHQFAQARQEYQNILAAYPRSGGALHNLLLLDHQEALFLRSRGQEREAQALWAQLLSNPQLPLELRQEVMRQRTLAPGVQGVPQKQN